MSRIFAYCRVSTTEKTIDSQVQEIRAAGFDLLPGRIIKETVAGSMVAPERKRFIKLFDKLKAGDVLIVTKLGQLGSNALDVHSTVESLEAIGVGVHFFALGGVDLTSPAGKMTMQVINAVTEFERDLIIERTESSIKRARAIGKNFADLQCFQDGRKPKYNVGSRAVYQPLN